MWISEFVNSSAWHKTYLYAPDRAFSLSECMCDLRRIEELEVRVRDLEAAQGRDRAQLGKAGFFSE